MRRLAIVSLLAVLVFVVAASRQVPKEISVEDKAAIQELMDNFFELIVAEDWDGLINLYTGNAVELLPNGAIYTGKTDIRNRWQGWTDYDYTSMDIKTDISGYGDTASVFVNFTATFTRQPGGAPETSAAIQYGLLKKVGGVWKIAVWTWVREQ